MISLERYSNVYEIESPVEEWYTEGWSTCQRETTLDLSTPFEGNKKKVTIYVSSVLTNLILWILIMNNNNNNNSNEFSLFFLLENFQTLLTYWIQKHYKDYSS